MTARNQILIVTEELDPHADHMIVLLREMGQQPVRLHTADLPLQASMSCTYTGDDWGGAVQTQGRTIDIAALRSIWWRRPQPQRLPAELSEDERSFARLEWQITLRGVWDAIDCYWMSRPHNIALASAKPSQLARAAAIGFEIPRTIITTEPSAARAFYDACGGRMVYKVLSDPMLGMSTRIDEINQRLKASAASGQGERLAEFRPRGVYTTLVKEEQLTMLETIRLTPCQFQEYVPKRTEVRVTVVGDEVFAAEIDSQSHERTSVDWRHYDVAVPYRAADLPREVADRCYAITRSYGLNFSTIDLILTPDGRYVFLEINPNGQWLWIQELVPELKIAEAIADRLTRGDLAA